MANTICDKPYDNSDKWTASIMLGVVFLLLSSPCAYSITDGLAKYLGLNLSLGTSTNVLGTGIGIVRCPNLSGILIHTLVFIFVVRLLLNRDTTKGCIRPYTSKDKWTVALIAGLLFLLISSPFLYDGINEITSKLGFPVSDGKGCPTSSGLMLHSIVFILIARLLIR